MSYPQGPGQPGWQQQPQQPQPQQPQQYPQAPPGYPPPGYPPQAGYPQPGAYPPPGYPQQGGYPPAKPPKIWPAYDAGLTAVIAGVLTIVATVLGLNDEPEGIVAMVGVTMFDGIDEGTATALSLVLAVPVLIGGILLLCRLSVGRWICLAVGVIGAAHYIYAIIYLIDAESDIGVLAFVTAVAWVVVPIGAIRPSTARAMKNWRPAPGELPRY